MARQLWTVALACLLMVACGDDDASTDDAGAGDSGASGECTRNADCDDGNFCNGTEICSPGDGDADPMGCVAGSSPCIETQTCDEEDNRCISDCDTAADADGDGVESMDCGGSDCDDSNANRFPGNTEVCDAAGADEDCDMTTTGGADADGDGFEDAECCNGDTCGDDCDDTRASINPTSTEACDGFDNDCDGNTDEGVQVAGFADLDGDLHGDPDAPLMACADSAGFSSLGDDCDDGNKSVHGAQVEICDNLDNDCDEMTDETPAAVAWFRDVDEDGYGSAESSEVIISCTPIPGRSLRSGDYDDNDPLIHPGAAERCNGIDDNCDGLANFLVGPDDYENDDGDSEPDARCAMGNDCDDSNPSVYPGAAEICDGIDNNCDGISDDTSDETTWFRDADGDGYGVESDTTTACVPPTGYAVRAGDCDDTRNAIHPGVADRCDEINNDCDDATDEDAPLVAYFGDGDMDGFFGGEPTISCLQPPNTSVDGRDCDDMDNLINPDGTEIENCRDDDCDDGVDEGFAEQITCGEGACEVTIAACEMGMGVMCTPGDPNPAGELCNGVDDNCNGTVDDGADANCFVGDPLTVGVCNMGTCSIVGCVGTGRDCNMQESDGCEVDIDNDPNNCGQCGVSCRAGDECAGGRCQNRPVDIVAGRNHSCVLLGSGTAYCWGANGLGQLGDQGTMRSLTANPVTSISSAVQIESIADHTCVRLADDTMQCWGRDDCGQLGRNNGHAGCTTASRWLNEPTTVLTTSSQPLTAVIDITASELHSCALTDNGKIWCWGHSGNEIGGRGHSSSAAMCAGFTDATTNAGSDIESGREHNLVLRIAPEVHLGGFGDNTYRQLGNNSSGGSSAWSFSRDNTGAAIPDVIDFAVGGTVTCIIRPGGQVQCVGSDDFGQQGGGDGDQLIDGYVDVPGADDYTQLWAGWDQVCGKRADNSVWCWGRNQEGQLGVGGNMNREVPTMLTVVPAALEIVDMAIGFTHACAILSNERVACWGQNANGQLGNNSTNPATDSAVFVIGLP